MTEDQVHMYIYIQLVLAAQQSSCAAPLKDDAAIQQQPKAE